MPAESTVSGKDFIPSAVGVGILVVSMVIVTLFAPGGAFSSKSLSRKNAEANPCVVIEERMKGEPLMKALNDLARTRGQAPKTYEDPADAELALMCAETTAARRGR